MKIEEFEQLKQKSLGHCLIKAARLYNEMAFSKLKEKIPFDGFRPSHLQVFPHVSFSGSTIVEISKKLSISKQATSILVNDLIEWKLLKKQDHPHDKRSFLVTFVEDSDVSIFKGFQELQDLDVFLGSFFLKKNDKEVVHEFLLKLIDTLEV